MNFLPRVVFMRSLWSSKTSNKIVFKGVSTARPDAVYIGRERDVNISRLYGKLNVSGRDEALTARDYRELIPIQVHVRGRWRSIARKQSAKLNEIGVSELQGIFYKVIIYMVSVLHSVTSVLVNFSKPTSVCQYKSKA